MAQFFKATSVSVTNGGTIVTVNAGDDVALIRTNSLLQINTNQVVEVKTVNTGAQTIELFLPWDNGTVTAGSAVAAPTAADLKAAIDDVRTLTAAYQGLVDDVSVAATAGSIVRRNQNGKVLTANASAVNEAIAYGQPAFSLGGGGFTGNIDIGNDSSPAILKVNSGDSSFNTLLKSDVNSCYLYLNDTNTTLNSTVGIGSQFNDLAIRSGNSETARFTNGGGFLVSKSIATSSVTGFQVDNTGQTFVTTAELLPLTLNRTVTDGTLIRMKRADSIVGSIIVTNEVTSYSTTSDYRLKQDIRPILNASESVLQLNPCNFQWKSDKTRTNGFIAHEVQEIEPTAATGEKDGEDMQVMDASKLVPLLTAALQDALKRIEILEDKI